MSGEIVVKKPDFNPESLIAKAIESNVPVETMERLLEMRRQLKEEYSKEMFYKSLAAFQSECPVIKKTKTVNFTSKRTGSTVKYSYAPIETIVIAVRDLLKKHGFSYTIKTETTDKGVKAICIITHEDGHSDQSPYEVPIDSEAFMNAQQKVASALTFAKRYAFCNGFGILSGDEDDDGRGASDPEGDVDNQNIPDFVRESENDKNKKCPECHAVGKYHKPGCKHSGI